MRAVGVLVAALLGSPAGAASFDCARANSPAERAVCADGELSRLDERLAAAYRQALEAAPEAGPIRAGQRRWLASFRDACGADAACLGRAYRSRLAALEALLPGVVISGLGEEAIRDAVRRALGLDARVQVRLVPVRSGDSREVKTVAFFPFEPDAPDARRGLVEVSGAEPRLVLVEGDPCGCSGLSAASARRLVSAEPDFVVTSHSPRAGTCVAAEVVRVLRVVNGRGFQVAWQGESYSASGPEAIVSEIAFPDRDGDGTHEIRVRARKLHCGDDCFCRDGKVLGRSESTFRWDGAAGRFR